MAAENLIITGVVKDGVVVPAEKLPEGASVRIVELKERRKGSPQAVLAAMRQSPLTKEESEELWRIIKESRQLTSFESIFERKEVRNNALCGGHEHLSTHDGK